MRFMMFMLPNIPADGDWMPSAEAVAEMSKYNQELQKAGVLLALDGLHPQTEGVRVTFSGGKQSVTDGPFTEAKEMIGGYWIIDVKSKAEAVEWASALPAGGGRHRAAPDLRPLGVPARRAGRGRRTARLIPSDPLSTDGEPRSAPFDRRGLADRVAQAHRGPDAHRARRRAGRGARAGRARRGARAVARVRRPGQPGRLAHGHGQAPRDRRSAPAGDARAQARSSSARELEADGANAAARDVDAGARRRRRRRPAAPRVHRRAIRCCRPRRASRSRCACSAG